MLRMKLNWASERAKRFDGLLPSNFLSASEIALSLLHEIRTASLICIILALSRLVVLTITTSEALFYSSGPLFRCALRGQPEVVHNPHLTSAIHIK